MTNWIKPFSLSHESAALAAIQQQIENWKGDNCLYLAQSPTWTNQEVATRVASVAVIVLKFAAHVGNGIQGSLATLASIATLGLFPRINCMADNNLSEAGLVVADLYFDLLSIVNPCVEIDRGIEIDFDFDKLEHACDFSDNIKADFAEMDGLITGPLRETMNRAIQGCIHSPHLLMRQISSRIFHLVLLLLCLVTRTVEAVIGVTAAIASFLTLGLIPRLNEVAYRSLKAPRIVADTAVCLRAMVNPLKEGNPCYHRDWDKP